MGALLSSLLLSSSTSPSSGSNAASRVEEDEVKLKNVLKIFELQYHQQQQENSASSKLLSEISLVLRQVESYSGCSELIRQAISLSSSSFNNNSSGNGGEGVEMECWKAVCVSVRQLAGFYGCSVSLSAAFSDNLRILCSSNNPNSNSVSSNPASLDISNAASDYPEEEMMIWKNMEVNQEACYELANILSFAMHFDEVKMRLPALQNDFSYYRRTLGRIKLHSAANNNNSSTLNDNTERDGMRRRMMEMAPVAEEETNHISLFISSPTPMLATLISTVTSSPSVRRNQRIPAEMICKCLNVLAEVCHRAIVRNAFVRNEMVSVCLRVVVASLVLIDHCDPIGVFVDPATPSDRNNNKNYISKKLKLPSIFKGNMPPTRRGIDVEEHIKLIQTYAGAQTRSLLNALRYSTKHFNDASTPKAVRQLLAG